MTGPKEAILGVTWKCNSQCRICDIWSRKSNQRELRPEEYQALPKSLKQISLGGYGEPFLRDDLPDIVHSIRKRCPKARIVIVTNGLMPRRILDRVKKFPEGVSIRVSLDGIGEIHDAVRGVPGAFKKTKQTLSLLKKHGIRDLGIGCVINKINESDIENVFDFAQDNNLSFSSTLVQSSDITFGHMDGLPKESLPIIRAVSSIMKKLLKSSSPRDWAVAYFLEGIRSVLENKTRKIPCAAGKDFFYMDPSGRVYPCNVLSMQIGSAENGTMRLFDRDTSKILKYVEQCPHQCWMTCTVTPYMKRRPLRPLLWIIKNRLFGFNQE